MPARPKLAGAIRRLTRAVETRYAQRTGRLEAALRTAAALREATADEAALRDHELAGRQEALDRVLALLHEATASTDQNGPAGAPRLQLTGSRSEAVFDQPHREPAGDLGIPLGHLGARQLPVFARTADRNAA
jgi:hypothetical protein